MHPRSRCIRAASGGASLGVDVVTTFAGGTAIADVVSLRPTEDCPEQAAGQHFQLNGYHSRRVESRIADPVNERIAARVRALRSRRGLTLDSLAGASGVSRSALSLIERAESSPTAVVLDKIAGGLGVPLASLFGEAPDGDTSPITRRADQPVWRDPGSGYVRRRVSPRSENSPVEIVDVTFPARARVAFESRHADGAVHQQLWVLRGTIDFTIGEETHRLHAGDCLATTLDRPTMFSNPTDRAARYAVVVATEPSARSAP